MTADQFAALSRLLRLHSGSPTSAGLRLVLVDGLSHVDAAEAIGVQRQNITRALKSARSCIADAHVLAGVPVPAERNY